MADPDASNGSLVKSLDVGSARQVRPKGDTKMKRRTGSGLDSVRTALGACLMVPLTLSVGAPLARGQERESRAYPPTLEGASEVAVYKTVGDTELKLYIFQPAGNQPGNLTPAILFYFGGGWTNGSPEQWHRQCLYFSSRGMVAIAVDYRVRSRNDTTPLDAVHDAKSSVRWVRQNGERLGIDPSRIAACGGSAGGQLAAAAGIIDGLDEPGEDLSVSSRANALVLYNPAVVMAPVEGTDLGRGHGPGGDTDEERQAISPYHHVNKGDPPTITFHGREDRTIPYAAAEAFTEKMVDVGNRAELVLFDEAGHGFFNSGSYYPDVLARTDRFLATLGFLKGEPTVP
jgi:acetyl esterase